MKKLLLLSFILFANKVIIAQNLVASYLFNGDANDATGNSANNGTVNGANLTSDRFGNTNSAYYFDGIDDFIEANADNMPIGNSTISVWFNADVGSIANRPGLFGYGGNSSGSCPGNSHIMILNLSGQNKFTTQAHCLNNYADYAYPSAPESKWYNWVVTTNETTIKMYLNGELVSTANTNSQPKIVAGKKLTIGAVVGPSGTSNYTDPNVGRFKGVIDDVKIYDSYLTDNQIANKYFAESVIAFYPFNGDTFDESGNNNHGNNITTATLTSDRFGNSNAAYSFTTSDFIEVLNSNSFQIGTNDYTLQYWIKTTAADAVIMGKGPHTVLGIMQYVNGDGTIQARSEFPAGILNSDIAINNNVWHQVVFVRKGTTSKIFVDGRLSNSATLPLSDISNTDSFYIGHDGPDPFAGQLDDIKLYNAALNDATVFDNYIKDQKMPGSGIGLQLTRTGDRATDPWVNIGTGYDFGNEPFTYETWVKRDDLHQTSNNYGVVLIVSELNNGWGIGLDNNNNLFFTKVGVNGVFTTGPSSTIADTKWHHVTVVYTGSQLKFYIDGIIVFTSNYTDNFGNSAGNYTIGARQGFGNANGDQTLNGMIDETRIWRNVALSETEIRDWMCKKITSIHPQYSKLFAYFNFDENPVSLPMAKKSAIVLNPTVRGFGGHFGELINNPILQTSGAAIGDASDHDYVSSIKSALIGHTTGESFLAESITGDPAGIQLYRVDEAPSNLTGHNGLDPFPTYYGVFQTGGTNPTYTGTYTYYGNQIPGGIEANLRLYSRENNSATSWTENAALPDMPIDKIVLTGQSTEYILGSALTTLPLNLLSFSGKNTNVGNQLNWLTANEVALSHFEIERSENAKNFVKIAEMKANGGPSEKVSYEFLDNQNSSFIAHHLSFFYRLRIVDLDGKFKYSKIINIQNKLQSELKVYPNPTSDYFSLLGNQTYEKLQIVDMNGRVVRDFLPQNDNNYSLKGLNTGIYLVKVLGGKRLIDSKLVVK